jgi:hypothetical protein
VIASSASLLKRSFRRCPAPCFRSNVFSNQD